MIDTRRWRKPLRINIAALVLCLCLTACSIRQTGGSLPDESTDTTEESELSGELIDDTGESEPVPTETPGKPGVTAETSTESFTEPPAETSTEEMTEPEPTEPPLTDAQVALIEEADRLAAGYDYDAAMALIQTHEGFAEVSAMTEALVRYENRKAATVKWESIEEITHVFYHSLIVDPVLAFDGDEDEYNYNRVMTTVEEFKKIM